MIKKQAEVDGRESAEDAKVFCLLDCLPGDWSPKEYIGHDDGRWWNVIDLDYCQRGPTYSKSARIVTCQHFQSDGGGEPS